MSANKMKYFQVTTTAIVQANNQTDAVELAFGGTVSGTVLSEEYDVARLTAAEARTLSTDN